ncbi:hypothetical protein Tco_1214815 [Tanacetum coccineum]
MVEKVLADQKGQNVEVYLEEIVVKSKDEQSLIKDVEETFNKLKWVNMKIDPNESTFRMKEGRFLGYNVTDNGIRLDPTKIQTVVTNSPMEEILKIPGIGGRLAKWAVEIRTYSISYVRTNEAEGQMVNKFPKQKELLPHILKGKEEGALRQSNEL